MIIVEAQCGKRNDGAVRRERGCFLPGHAQLLVRYWWRRFHPKCASGGAVERIDRARVRGIWWRGNAKRVGVLLIKVSCCEFSGIATVSAPGCTPRNNHLGPTVARGPGFR